MERNVCNDYATYLVERLRPALSAGPGPNFLASAQLAAFSQLCYRFLKLQVMHVTAIFREIDSVGT